MRTSPDVLQQWQKPYFQTYFLRIKLIEMVRAHVLFHQKPLLTLLYLNESNYNMKPYLVFNL